MVMVQPNKETIFTFNGSTSFFIVLMFFLLLFYVFSMAGLPMKFTEMLTSEECGEGVETTAHTPPPRDVSISLTFRG